MTTDKCDIISSSGIANTLDLTDRILPRLQAREKCKPQLLNFAPYTKNQIATILQDRLNQVSAKHCTKVQCQALFLVSPVKGKSNNDSKIFCFDCIAKQGVPVGHSENILCEFPPMAPFIGCFSVGINLREESLKCFSNSLMEQEMATYCSVLAWIISWIEEPGGLQPRGLQTVGHD